jgi:hypothetical protein
MFLARDSAQGGRTLLSCTATHIGEPFPENRVIDQDLLLTLSFAIIQGPYGRSSMSETPDPPSLHSEIARRIGRNVLLYQRIELILKELDRFSGISGTREELPRVISKAHKRSQGHTMGGAASRFLEQAASELSEEPVDLKGEEVHLSLHWSIKDGKLSRQKRGERFQSLVKDRNRLVHGILKEFDLTSVESCEELLEWLDSAYESARGVDDEVRGILEGYTSGIKLLMTPEVKILLFDPDAEIPDKIRVSGTEFIFTREPWDS